MNPNLTPLRRAAPWLAASALGLLLAVPAAAQYRVATNAISYSNAFGSLASASYNNPNGGASLILGLSDNPAAGASGAVDGTTDPVGNRSSSFDRSSVFETPALPRSANAYAASDLSSGTLKAFAQSNSVLGSPYGSSGHGYAAFSDTLHWSVAGANNNTVTTLGVRFSLDGSYAKDSLLQTSGSMDWALNFGGATVLTSTAWLGANPVGTTQQAIGNAWASGAFTRNVQTNTLTDLVFEGSYQLVGASGSLGVVSYLDAFVTGGTIDFSHTGLFAFTSLPVGLSLTSDSGVFPVTTAVAEPQTLALMLAGLGALGWLARRRRR